MVDKISIAKPNLWQSFENWKKKFKKTYAIAKKEKKFEWQQKLLVITRFVTKNYLWFFHYSPMIRIIYFLAFLYKLFLLLFIGLLEQLKSFKLFNAARKLKRVFENTKKVEKIFF